MLKTILEKDKTTLVHQKETLPLFLGMVGILMATMAFFTREEVPSEVFWGLVIGSPILWAMAYLLFQRKQILVIDSGRAMIEEYRGQERTTFSFDDVRNADVARVREEPEPENEEHPETFRRVSIQSPRLHYHPFLNLKSAAEGNYFLWDERGKGMARYREARRVVEAINDALALPKETVKALNMYQMKSKGETPFFYPVVIVILVAMIAYLLLSQYGYL